MLDPQTRVVLLEALQPPEGYALDEGIGTTYSLDLVTLLSTPLAFTQYEWEDAKGAMTSNPVLLLEALRRHVDRLTVFCQVGRIAVPVRPNPLFGYLEECVVETAAPHPTGVFHPKIWLLRFLNPETREVWYRFLCLTRNLTDDPSWDLSAMLEGPLMDRKVAYASNHPLADFIAALPDLAHRGATTSVKARAERMAAEARKVDFRSHLPQPFEDYAFHPLGIKGLRTQPFAARNGRTLVVSPFVTADVLEELVAGTKGSVLVSREEELDRLPAAALKGWERVYVLASDVEGEQEPQADGDAPMTERPRGLHAKLYLREEGWNCSLLVGSANATGAALHRNVEFLLQLTAKKSKAGIDAILTPEDGQASLVSLLQQYEPPEAPVDDRVERLLDDLVNAARAAMAAAGWTYVATQGPGTAWELRLERVPGANLAIPEGVEVRVWPVTLRAESSVQRVPRDAPQIRFVDVGAGELTTFLGCEVSAEREGRKQLTRFALVLPLVGGPAGRREAILRQVLDDPQKVLRFLQFLLGEGVDDPMGGDGSPVEGTGVIGRGQQEEFVVLEALLRALAHDPNRLDEVHRLLQDLGDGDEGRRRIPHGLLEVWPAIWAARQGIRA